jgi:hypothetical protein
VIIQVSLLCGFSDIRGQVTSLKVHKLRAMAQQSGGSLLTRRNKWRSSSVLTENFFWENELGPRM